MKPPPSAMNDLYQKTAGMKTGERLPTAMVSVKAAKFVHKGAAADATTGIGIIFTLLQTHSQNSVSFRKENPDRRR